MTMPPEVTFQELLNELDRLAIAMALAKKALLEADANYECNGVRAEEKVKRHVQRYADPAEGRARKIRETADSIASEITKFSETRVRLLERAAAVLMLTVVAVHADIIDELKAAITERGSMSLAGKVVPSLPLLKDVQRRQVLTMARVVVVGRRTENAINLVTQLVQLHQGRLEQFVGDNLTVNIDSVVDGLKDLFAEKAKDRAFETLADVVISTLKLGGNIVPLAPIITLCWDIGKKLNKIRQHYTPRNDADDLLDFGDELTVVYSACGDAVELMDKLSNVLTEKTA